MRNSNRALYLIAALGISLASVPAVAQDDTAVLNSRAAALDPEDYKFVQPVCTQCHGPANFLHSRSWPQWQDVFSRMYANGARASDDQWGRIYDYFRKSLTTINVNRADEDELSAVLGVSEKAAIDIVRRRYDRAFDSAEDLETVPGVDKAAVEAIRPRLLFDRAQQGR